MVVKVEYFYIDAHNVKHNDAIVLVDLIEPSMTIEEVQNIVRKEIFNETGRSSVGIGLMKII